MAEQKKRGFHALEQRIHEMEEEDKRQQSQQSSSEQGAGSARREPSETRSSEKAKR